jgi:hypothetical protein
LGNLEKLLWSRGDFVEFRVKKCRGLSLAGNIRIFRLFWKIG